MSQATMTLTNVARTLFRSNLNAALAALSSCQSGTSRPSDIPAGGLWVNTTTATAWVLNLYDGADDIAIGTFNTTTNVFTPSIANNSLLPSKLALGAWTTVASAATVDLGAQTSRNIILSGTTGITSFGSTATPDNVPFNVRFSGSLTITHSANLICPGAANLSVVAGDSVTVVQIATGTWVIVAYSLATLPAINGSQLTGLPVPASTGRLLRAPQFLTSGTSYTTPAGCNYVHVIAIGGGGGGKSSTNGGNNGRGGSAGLATEYSLSVAPNTTYNYSIGAGGNAGSPGGSDSASGGNTVITLAGFTITAEGSRGNSSNGFNGGNGGPIFGAAAGNNGGSPGGLGYGAGGAGGVWASQSSNGVQGIIVIWEYAI